MKNIFSAGKFKLTIIIKLKLLMYHEMKEVIHILRKLNIGSGNSYIYKYTCIEVISILKGENPVESLILLMKHK